LNLILRPENLSLTKMSSQAQKTHPSRPSSSSSTDTTHKSNSDWTTGFTIDDEDITFDGQPLSALYEMTRYRYVQSSPRQEQQQQQQPEERGRKRDR
jgi:hypothetical protein